MAETIFGNLRKGDVIKDKNGDVWGVESVQRPVEGAPTVSVTITSPKGTYPLTRPVTDPVERLDIPADAIDAVTVVSEVLGGTVTDVKPRRLTRVEEAEERHAARTGDLVNGDGVVVVPAEAMREALARPFDAEVLTGQDSATPALEVLPPITSPYHLRSHLFLAHGASVVREPELGWQRFHEGLHLAGPHSEHGHPHRHEGGV